MSMQSNHDRPQFDTAFEFDVETGTRIIHLNRARISDLTEKKTEYEKALHRERRLFRKKDRDKIFRAAFQIIGGYNTAKKQPEVRFPQVQKIRGDMEAVLSKLEHEKASEIEIVIGDHIQFLLRSMNLAVLRHVQDLPESIQNRLDVYRCIVTYHRICQIGAASRAHITLDEIIEELTHKISAGWEISYSKDELRVALKQIVVDGEGKTGERKKYFK